MSIWQDTDGTLHDDMDGAALTLPIWPQGMTLLSADQAFALQNPTPTSEALWAAYQLTAQDQLDRNDKVAIRCIKAGVPYTAEWIANDDALRLIVKAKSGDFTQPLPSQPSNFPPGS